MEVRDADGHIIEGTESLIDCARGGRSGHAISNLFDRTLAGWRKHTCRRVGGFPKRSEGV